jgi:hypothetical protein
MARCPPGVSPYFRHYMANYRITREQVLGLLNPSPLTSGNHFNNKFRAAVQALTGAARPPSISRYRLWPSDVFVQPCNLKSRKGRRTGLLGDPRPS